MRDNPRRAAVAVAVAVQAQVRATRGVLSLASVIQTDRVTNRNCCSDFYEGTLLILLVGGLLREIAL